MKSYLALPFCVVLAMLAGSRPAWADFCDLIPTSTPGVSLADSDCDKVPDRSDNCPATKNGNCALGVDRCDIDGNGSLSDVESNGGNQADFNFNGQGDACEDTDSDGVGDVTDNCPDEANADQRDTDGNGTGDACFDTDNDTVNDAGDNCRMTYNPMQDDDDDDGVGNACDNCRFTANTLQEDSDGDRVGNICETDLDNDTILNDSDNCPSIPNTAQFDFDEDGFGNACDTCPMTPNEDQTDSDRDGLGDACDQTQALESIQVPPPENLGESQVERGSGGCALTHGSAARVMDVAAMLIFLVTLWSAVRFGWLRRGASR